MSPEGQMLDDTEHLAGLRLNRGYQQLLRILGDECEKTAGLILAATSNTEIVRLARFWQALTYIADVMVTAPERAQTEIERLRDEAPDDDDRDFLAPRRPQPLT